MGSHVVTGRRLAARVAAAAAAALFVAGIWLAAGSVVRAAYAPLCHQLPERSFHWHGAACAVCARCTGIYLGGLLGLVLGACGLLRRVAGNLGLRLLVATALPTVVDFGLGTLGAPSLGALGRMALALPPGAVAGLLLSGALADLAGRAPRPVQPLEDLR